MKLTHATLLNAKPQDKPYKIRDSQSLYLLVSVAGSKRWKFDYRLDGKDCTFTLGTFPELTITDARKKRNEAAELVDKGIHPKANEKSIQQANIDHHKNTFWPICEDWLEANKDSWTDYYYGQAKRFLTRYVKDTPLGSMPARDVTPAQIFELLQSIAKRKTLAGDERKTGGAPHIAVRVRQHLDAIFRRAIISGRADSNPVAALKVSDILTLPETRHNVALDAHGLKRVMGAIPAMGPLTRLAMRLLLLTSVRTIELRGATWKEFDFDARLWSIPGERMKMSRPHVVPLSTQAVEVLKEIQALNGSSGPDDYLFPNVKDKTRPMAPNTINAALNRAGFNDAQLFRAHGARGTFTTWADEAGFNSKAVDRQLAHVEKNRVRRSYSKAEYLPERQKMMQVWADFLQTISN